MKIVIRCGGAGTRLWPTSRESRPKQFQPLLGSESLFTSKLNSIRPLVRSWDDVYISTVESYVPIIRKLAPRVRRDHIIAEPVRRNTGPGIALETTVIAAQQRPGQDPVIASLTVDDVMRNGKLFRDLLRHAGRYLEHDEPSAIVTIGCPPAGADTGLSYLVLGKKLVSGRQYQLRRVSRWIEKPDEQQLRRLLKTSDIAAHTGLYVWRASTVMNILAAHEPVLFARMQRIGRAVGTRRERTVIRREFPKIQSASVEELVARRATRIVAAVAELGWKDTGKWFLVQEVLRREPGANVHQGNVVLVDTEDSLVYGPPGKLIATVGLKGYVVVDTGDALLVCPKDRSGDVKKIVEHLKATGAVKLL
ncbi:MAG: mannose-1-phosphate guanylyltransferase [Candidatus Kerfeldbacteria bacterium]|nr:mannose-1-phosphate guanylyltransferase [Candidatus Kerfeldbacteria bacterium]